MNEFVASICGSDFLPHGHCYFWKPDILWMHVLGDGVTSMAYFIIPFLIFHFIKNRADAKFSIIFKAFALFILFCGITHIFSIVSIWHPLYRLEGLLKICTALVSIGTVVIVALNMPLLLKIPSIEQLKASNDALQNQVEITERAHNQLENLNKSLELKVEERTKELKKRNDELRMIQSIISHDFRSPLSNMHTLANHTLSCEASLSEDGKEILRLFAQKSKHLATALDELLSLNSLNDFNVNVVAVHLEELVSTLLDEVSLELNRKPDEIKLEFNAEDTIQADPKLLYMLLRNVLHNAVKYSKNKAAVLIKVQVIQRENWQQLIVQDEGEGFDSSKAKNLFVPFQRYHNVNSFEGTGVGLAIVKRIMDLHKGEISIVSSKNTGTVVTMLFPT